MTATIGFMLRLEPDLYEAIERIAPRGTKNEYIRQLIRADLERRAAEKKAAGKGRKT